MRRLASIVSKEAPFRPDTCRVDRITVLAVLQLADNGSHTYPSFASEANAARIKKLSIKPCLPTGHRLQKPT